MRVVAPPHGTVPDIVDLLKEMEALRAERDALHHRLEANAADLDTILQIRDEFIAVASHDLKSPLTSILGGAQYIERLLTSPMPDAVKAVEWARVIQDQARTMTLLINDLLDATRVQTGAFDLRLLPCDMGVCVATATGRLVPPLQTRVSVTAAPYPVRGRWDRQRIEQVLSNLLDNALKYSPNEETVSVAVAERAEEIEVSVSDRGVGIAPVELPRIFERFYRTTGASAAVVPGTGLGLFICERIITAHGGRLWVESAGPGTGSTFRFTLPLAPHTLTRPEGSGGQAR